MRAILAQVDTVVITTALTIIGTGLGGVGIFVRKIYDDYREGHKGLTERIEALEADVEKCHGERITEALERGKLMAQVDAIERRQRKNKPKPPGAIDSPYNQKT
jgi:hypothetical protein